MGQLRTTRPGIAFAFRLRQNVLQPRIDEKTAVEKRTACYQLVQASDFKGALTTFLEGMHDTLADFEIASITETPLMDVFPVDLNETRAEREVRQKAQKQ